MIPQGHQYYALHSSEWYLTQDINNSVIQLNWVFYKQSMSSSRLSLCVGVCNRETLLLPPAPTAPRRDFPFLEIRIRAILSLIEYRRTALPACVCLCTRLLLTVCVCKICAYKWQCVCKKMSSVIERLREVMCACACRNQSVCVSRGAYCLNILYVCTAYRQYKSCSECRGMWDKMSV